MSLVPRQFLDPDVTFTPLFRFLDEFNNYSTAGDVQTFTPKFDIQEHKRSYSLHGEFPGADRQDVEIEFTDPQVRYITLKQLLGCIFFWVLTLIFSESGRHSRSMAASNARTPLQRMGRRVKRESFGVLSAKLANSVGLSLSHIRLIRMESRRQWRMASWACMCLSSRKDRHRRRLPSPREIRMEPELGEYSELISLKQNWKLVNQTVQILLSNQAGNWWRRPFMYKKPPCLRYQPISDGAASHFLLTAINFCILRLVAQSQSMLFSTQKWASCPAVNCFYDAATAIPVRGMGPVYDGGVNTRCAWDGWGGAGGFGSTISIGPGDWQSSV